MGIDPTRFSGVKGATCDLYIVESKGIPQWLVDPTLADVRGAPQEIPFPQNNDIQDFITTVTGSAIVGDQEPCFSGVCIGLGHPYDAVLDCDRSLGSSGQPELGPGDFIDGAGDEAGFYLTVDTAAGKLAVECVDEQISAGIVTPPFQSHRVYAPANLDSVAECDANGCANPVSIVLISHGGGHEYNTYNTIGRHLASWGFVVVVHQNNTSNPEPEEAAETTLQHTHAIFELLDDANCSSLLDEVVGCGLSGVSQLDFCSLKDRIDSSRIVWIGHSRGGPGVLFAYDRLAGLAGAPFTSPWFKAKNIVLLGNVGPIDLGLDLDQTTGVDFVTTPGTVPYHLFWSGGDADVTGMPNNVGEILESFQIYERATGHKQVTYLHGGAHGWFHNDCPNTSTGPEDTDCQSLGNPIAGPVTEAEVHQLIKSYYVPLIKAYAEGNVAAQDYLWRPAGQLLPSDLDVTLEHKFGLDDRRIVIDDFETNPSPTLSSEGNPVAASGLTVVEGEFNDQDCHFDFVRTTVGSGGHIPEEECTGNAGNCPDPNGICSCEDLGPEYGVPVTSTGPGTPCEFVPGCEFVASQPMNGMTRMRTGFDTSSGVVLEWPSGSGPYLFDIETPSTFGADPETLYLSFRVAQMPRHPKILVLDDEVDFDVTLIDSVGNESTVALSAYGAEISRPYPRSGPGMEHRPLSQWVLDCPCIDDGTICCNPGGCNPFLSEEGWQAEFETVRIRLSDFLTNGSQLDLEKLETVRFEFALLLRSSLGRIAIDDVELTSPGFQLPPPPPCPAVEGCNGSYCTSGNEMSSVDTTVNVCELPDGSLYDCLALNVHVVQYACDLLPCCSDPNPCVCASCANGTYLECR